tara:strand:+ start:56 stop:676 length:621 start_codon:yes stop_codon:yes gene_type:complete
MSGVVSQNVGRTSGLIKAVSGGGVWTLIKTLTASADSTLSFVDGTDDVVLDSTYPIYLFKFTSIHPSANGENFGFQGNVAGGSGYNETITSTVFYAAHNEADTEAEMGYNGGMHLKQETSFQPLTDIGSDNDQCCAGELWLFGISSTTFVKHFIATMANSQPSDYTWPRYIGGYFNTTSAIDEFQFKMASGNIDAGTIKLYGIKDS